MNCTQFKHLIFPVLHAERRNCIPTHLTSKTQHSLQHKKPKSTCWTTYVLWMTLQAAKFSKFAIFSKAQPDSAALKYRENCLRLNSDYGFRISRAVKVLTTENKPTEKRWGQILQFSVLCYLINLKAKNQITDRETSIYIITWQHLKSFKSTTSRIRKLISKRWGTKKKISLQLEMVFIPFTWHLTKMFHSNGAGVIPQQRMGLVITQTSTILLGTPQKWEEKTGQRANSVLKLSFSNGEKSLKYFFRWSVCFLMQCCWLPSPPALLSCSTAIAQQRSQSLGRAGPFQLPLCLKQLCRMPRKSPEDGNGGITSWWSHHQMPWVEAHCKSHLFSAASLHGAGAQSDSQHSRAAFRNTTSLDLFPCRSIYSLKWCCKAKSQKVPNFKKQVLKSHLRAKNTHGRPLQAQAGKPGRMDISAPQHNSCKHLH